MILESLLEKEMCVSELMESLQMGQTSLSKHLSVLKNAGLVIDRKESTKVYYQSVRLYVQNFLNDLNNMVREDIAQYQASSEFIQVPSSSNATNKKKKKKASKKHSSKKSS
jgi:DNA-binding transcriptional ArsR family regulator